jgi:serine/threonine protein kinase
MISINKINKIDKLCTNLDIVDDVNQLRFDSFIYTQNFKTTIHNKNVIIHISDQINIILNITEKIGEGMFSNIYKLVDSKNKIVAALKVEKLENPIEHEISELLNKNKCNLLKVKYIGKHNFNQYIYNCYIMELANGDLNKLSNFYMDNIDKKQTLQFFRDIVEELRIQLLCLLEISNYKYVYTDVKLNNILYMCKMPQQYIKIFLGDLGSAVPDGNGAYIASFPPWEYKDNTEKGVLNLTTNTEKEKTLSWLIGILLLSFVSKDNVIDYYYANLDKMDSDIHRKKVKHFIIQTYGPQFAYYLSLNPKIREDIKNPLPNII